MDTDKKIIHVLNMIINDPDFICGGIPEMDKALIEEYGLTSTQSANIQVRLYNIARYMKKLKKF